MMNMEIIPIPLNYLFAVNCHLIKTEKGYHLIDSGLHQKRAQIEKELERAGCKPGDLNLIIITHGHTDHVGNAAYLKSKYGGIIAMHEADLKMVETGDMFINAKGGFALSLIKGLFGVLGFNSYEKFKPDVYLEDKQSLSEYGFDATVLLTPGHSPGSISVLTFEGNLFSGDLIMNSKKPEKTTLVDDQSQLDASVDLLKTCETSMVYPGHGKPFKMSDFIE
jgi:hydroxyacylglutathione hydrolase